MRALDLIEMLKHHELRVTNERVKLGDANCLVLEGDTEQSVDLGSGPKTIKTHQTFWLDLDHGLAVRQHEHRSELGFGRVVNSDFVEATPGFWLPRKLPWSISRQPMPRRNTRVGRCLSFTAI